MFEALKSKIELLQSKLKKAIDYCMGGVWSDTRSLWRVNIVKTLNLSVKSFLNRDIQSQACAMTYRTTLALVPAIALIFAIGRGFGLQEVIKHELLTNFSSQQKLLTMVFDYADSYISESTSGGLFVGIGIVLLLYTLISLLSSVESAFNGIWGVKNDRSIWRKTTDYLAIFFILPILMICASGLTVFVTTVTERVIPFTWVTPMVSFLLDVASLVLIWLFFTGVYMLIPNTKVKFKNAFIAGILAGTSYLILQWLFISGQVYVSKYNAIYGSVAFIPLLLIWLQFVWVITLAGAVVCYASQNIFRFSFSNEISRISFNYRTKIILAVLTIIVKRFESGKQPITDVEIASEYSLPSSMVSKSVNYLIEAGILMRVIIDPKTEVFGLAPAMDASKLTVGLMLNRLRNTGASNFIPGFNERFASVAEIIDKVETQISAATESTLVKDL